MLKVLPRADDMLEALAVESRNRPAAVVQALRSVRNRRRDLELERRELVERARSAGVSWSTIGGALGVSGQAAQQAQARH